MESNCPNYIGFGQILIMKSFYNPMNIFRRWNANESNDPSIREQIRVQGKGNIYLQGNNHGHTFRLRAPKKY